MMSRREYLGLFCSIGLLWGCTSAPVPKTVAPAPVVDAGNLPAALVADVIAVKVDVTTFRVTIRSPDVGCAQYANWWEVLRSDGTLVYRRILGHSHVDEQPFTRSGGPVSLAPDEVVWVRAYMLPGGYGGAAMKGSLQGGIAAAELPAEFAKDLATAAPQPTGCAF